MTQPEAIPSTTYAGLAADELGRPDERAALVFLHGLTFDRTMWRPTLIELETLDPGTPSIYRATVSRRMRRPMCSK